MVKRYRFNGRPGTTITVAGQSFGPGEEFDLDEDAATDHRLQAVKGHAKRGGVVHDTARQSAESGAEEVQL